VSAITAVRIDPIFDSRGHPTVEVEIVAAGGSRGRVGAPSGASTGRTEVKALPEGGVPAALRAFAERVAPALLGADLADRAGIDARLHDADGTPDFSRIGGNVATAASLASAVALANETGRSLWEVLRRPGVDGRTFPAIVGNCLNGGRHAIGGPEFQEFHAVSDAPRPDDAVRAALRVHGLVGEELHRRFPKLALGRGDEGGWVAPLGNVDALELLRDACDRARDELGVPVRPGLDLAASEFYSDGRYRYRDQTLDEDGQIGFVTKLAERYGVVYLEDPLEEGAYDGFARLTASVGARIRVVGDDLYTTHARRLERGIERKATNAVLIKVNQVGTLTDTLATVDLARAHGLATVSSHRSGDLPEGWLAHVAVGTGAWGLKCGLLGGERVAKLNELLRLGRAAR
jgi:enolase